MTVFLPVMQWSPSCTSAQLIPLACHGDDSRVGCDGEAQQGVEPGVVLLACQHPRVIPRLDKVQQDDHLDDKEEA